MKRARYYLVLVDGYVNSRPATLRLAKADASHCLAMNPSATVRISPVIYHGPRYNGRCAHA